jgi:D-sedoheptulose 7-phosphate isomerase
VKVIDILEKIEKDHTECIRQTLKQNYEIIELVSNVLVHAFESDNKILIFGNGGSAADAQHAAAEFINRFETERQPLPAIALTTDSSILTSIGNDYSFEDIFSKQIIGLGNKDDIAIGISTSTMSRNVLYALKVAHNRGLKTILLSGSNPIPKEYKNYIFYNISSQSRNTARIQESQIVIWHMICTLVDKYYENKPEK